MPVYRYAWDYRSSYGGGREGDTVEIDEELAAAINRDSPGALVPVTAEPEPESARAVDKPPSDRMHRRGRTRGDRGREEPIDKSTYKAVRG